MQNECKFWYLYCVFFISLSRTWRDSAIVCVLDNKVSMKCLWYCKLSLIAIRNHSSADQHTIHKHSPLELQPYLYHSCLPWIPGHSLSHRALSLRGMDPCCNSRGSWVDIWGQTCHWCRLKYKGDNQWIPTTCIKGYNYNLQLYKSHARNLWSLRS